MNEEFGLVVQVKAEDWAKAKSRLAFIEAALARVLRDNTQVREWFTAKELAAMKLPSLTGNPASITRKSAHHKWRHKTVMQEGRKAQAYHYSSLPNAAFEALIRRLIDVPDIEQFIPDLPPHESQKQVEPTPQWMLPLMRLIKQDMVDTWQEAYAMLEHKLPNHVQHPTPFEVENAYQRLRK